VVNLNSKIFVAGHRGMVGSAIVRQLNQLGYTNILLRAREDLDLTNQSQVNHFFEEVKPDYVYLAAAKVGGIHANNTYPADFIYQNLMIEANIIHASYLNNVRRLMFLGSSCIYPKYAEQPIKEDALLTGPLEPTNEAYAIAKIAGIKLCQSYNRQHGTDYRSLMPTNLYGPGDNYHPENSHVIPGLIRRIHDAKINNKNEVIVWGTGTPKREFLYVKDLAHICIELMSLEKSEYNLVNENNSHINIGSGCEITIKEIAELISIEIGFQGEIKFNSNMPDGTPRKILNSRILNKFNGEKFTTLKDGISETYSIYKKMIENK
jgi:GDP-L-fucose synthase